MLYEGVFGAQYMGVWRGIWYPKWCQNEANDARSTQVYQLWYHLPSSTEIEHHRKRNVGTNMDTIVDNNVGTTHYLYRDSAIDNVVSTG